MRRKWREDEERRKRQNEKYGQDRRKEEGKRDKC